MLRGGPDRLHQLLLGHHRPPESHRLHPRRHYPSVPGPVVPRVRSADALPGELAAVLRCGDPGDLGRAAQRRLLRAERPRPPRPGRAAPADRRARSRQRLAHRLAVQHPGGPRPGLPRRPSPVAHRRRHPLGAARAPGAAAASATAPGEWLRTDGEHHLHLLPCRHRRRPRGRRHPHRQGHRRHRSAPARRARTGDRRARPGRGDRRLRRRPGAGLSERCDAHPRQLRRVALSRPPAACLPYRRPRSLRRAGSAALHRPRRWPGQAERLSPRPPRLDRAALLRRLEEPLERCASALDPDQRGCAQLWSELLGCEVGAADQDFFLCGGNSLLALQLVALCQSAGAGANLGLADLQANSRLDQFSRLLRSHGLAPERLLERAATPEQPLVLSRSAA